MRCVWYVKGTNLKANHNWRPKFSFTISMCLICQRYKFKSKSQRWWYNSHTWHWCVWYVKGTNLKANHNTVLDSLIEIAMCLICQRYKFKSKSQRRGLYEGGHQRCVWYVKGTNLKANHNIMLLLSLQEPDVFDMSKVQI